MRSPTGSDWRTCAHRERGVSGPSRRPAPAHPGAERALEALARMTPLLVDDERERLAGKPPLGHPLVDALGGVVVLVDLDVDEVAPRRRPAASRTAGTTWTTGPHVRDWQYWGVANETTNGSCACERLRHGRRVERTVGRLARWSASAGRRPCSRASVSSTWIARSPTPGAALCLRTTMFPSAWIFLPPTGSARIPVRSRLRRRDRRHVDVLRVGRLATRDADRLEPRRRLREGRLLEAVGEPHAGRGPLDQLRLLVDDEERDRGSCRRRSPTSPARWQRPRRVPATAPRWSGFDSDAVVAALVSPRAAPSEPPPQEAARSPVPSATAMTAASGRRTPPDLAVARPESVAVREGAVRPELTEPGGDQRQVRRAPRSSVLCSPRSLLSQKRTT